METGDLSNDEFQKRYKTIIIDLRTDSPLRFHFMTVFFFRRAIYASIFVLLSWSPELQLVGGSFSVIAMLVYIVIVKPYASFLSMFLSIVNELLLIPMMLIPVRFLNPVISPEFSSTLGTLMMSIIIITIFINWCCIIVLGIYKFIQKKLAAKNLKTLKELHCYDISKNRNISKIDDTTTHSNSLNINSHRVFKRNGNVSHHNSNYNLASPS